MHPTTNDNNSAQPVRHRSLYICNKVVGEDNYAAKATESELQFAFVAEAEILDIAERRSPVAERL